MSEMNTENSKQKRGLGRGLGSLLGGASEAPQSSMVATPALAPKPTAIIASAPVASVPTQTPSSEGKVWQVGIDKLKSGQFQPRQNFPKESLQELAQSIKSHGILQPIIVRKTSSGSFEIVAGERRWRAAQLAGLHEVPVLIRNFEDQNTLELAIIENVQREDLNPIEEADAYSRLATEFHLSQQQIAEKVGKDRATVANAIRLLALTSDVKEMVSDGRLSVGHAKVLLSLPDQTKQRELAKKVLSEKMAVRKLEKLVSQHLSERISETPKEVAAQHTMNQLIAALSDELQKRLGTKVNIDYQNGKGKISIAFYSNEELNHIVDQLKASRK